MSTATTALPVLVVGAGPVGLTAAAELIRRGVPVQCIDRAEGPSGRSKALGLWPRTIEIISRIDGPGLLHSLAMPQSGMRYYSSGKVIANLRYRPETQPFICPQPAVEKVLQANLDRVGGSVRWGVEVLGVEQDQHGVRARLREADGSEHEVAFAWVIGADGAGSTVRGELGIGFEGSTYEMRFVVADVTLKTSLDRDKTHYFCSPAGILVACGLPSGRWRVFTSAPPGLDEDRLDLATVQQLVDLRGPGDITVSDPEWISVFSVHARHAAQTRVGRVFLAGDAAHIHSPAGGQGLNIGVGDAYNLAWKLAAVWKGQTGPELLDSYQPERSHVARAVVRQADRQTRLWLLKRRPEVALRDGLLQIASALRLFDLAYVPSLAGLRTTYPTGRGAGRRTGALVPGALVPAPVRRRLDDLRHTLLIGANGGVLTDGPQQALAHWCQQNLSEVLDVLVVDRQSLASPRRLFGGKGLRGNATVLALVRPDGHVETVASTAAPVEARIRALFRPLLQHITISSSQEEKVS